MSFETTAILLTWVAMTLLALTVAGLVRQVHQLTRGPHAPDVGPSPGSPAAALDRLGAEPGRTTLLLFLGEDCPACQDVFQEALTLTGAPPMRALFLTDVIPAVLPANMRVFADQGELFEAYQVPATPFAVVIGADGRIRTAEPIGSVRALHGIVAEAGGHLPSAMSHAGHDGPRN